jgi:hypothetical protein
MESSRTRYGWLGYAALVALLLALAIGATGAIGSGTTAKKKGLTKAAVKRIVKSEVKRQVAKARGPAGRTGPTGPAGAQGTPGPAGPAAPNQVKRLSFRFNVGSPLAVAYTGPGMRIEGECSTNQLALSFRASENGGVVHAFAVGADGVTYSGGGEPEVNNALILVPDGEGLVSGKLEYAAVNGATVTVNYMAGYGAKQGDCLFTGTVIETAPSARSAVRRTRSDRSGTWRPMGT